jgi:hypothetical protein
MSKKAKVPAFFLNFSGAHFLPNVPKMSVSSIFGLQMPKKSRQSLREISGASATDHLRLSFENSLAAQKFCERVGPDPKSLGNWTSPPLLTVPVIAEAEAVISGRRSLRCPRWIPSQAPAAEFPGVEASHCRPV